MSDCLGQQRRHAALQNLASVARAQGLDQAYSSMMNDKPQSNAG